MQRVAISLEQRELFRFPTGINLRRKHNFTYHILWSVLMVNFIGILSVLYAMISRVSPSSMDKILSTGDTFSALKITLLSVFISISITCIFGIPVAYILATHRGAFFNMIEAITFIPLVLPPSVAGLSLLMTFGKQGLIGSKLAAWGIGLPFTFFAIVLVQVFVAMPIFIQLMKNEFETIDVEIIEAAKVFGAGDGILLFKIFIPMSIKVIFTGMIVCALRAAGEFGATMMFAGNMVGKTQTLTTRIYSLYQYDVLQAVTLAVLQLLIVLVPLLLLKYFIKK